MSPAIIICMRVLYYWSPLIYSNVPANGKMTKKITMTPSMLGKHEVVAIFHSRQLVNITGSVELEIMA